MASSLESIKAAIAVYWLTAGVARSGCLLRSPTMGFAMRFHSGSVSESSGFLSAFDELRHQFVALSQRNAADEIEFR